MFFIFSQRIGFQPLWAFRRWLSLIIDGGLVLIAGMLAISIINAITNASFLSLTPLAWLVLAFLYTGWIESRPGRVSLGKWVCQIRLYSVTPANQSGWKQKIYIILLRYIARALVLFFLPLCCLWE